MFNSKQQNYLEKSKILKNTVKQLTTALKKRSLLWMFIVHRLKDMFNHSVDMFYLRGPGVVEFLSWGLVLKPLRIYHTFLS